VTIAARWKPSSWPTISPLVALVLALVLLGAGASLAIYNEHVGMRSRVREAHVQADILAASLAGPLAFDDKAASQEYIDALRRSETLAAVAAYDAGGRLVAGFSRDRRPPPMVNRVGPPRFHGDFLIVTEPVDRGDAHLGSIYLRTKIESVSRRVRRYTGIGVLVLMASLMVGGLGAAFGSVSEAHRRLQRETRSRETAEEALRQSQKMEAMGQLTGGVAHDFNNLLMVASSGLDLMERTDDPARRERLMQGIRQAIDRGASLTQQLLSFARRSAVHPEVIDLGARLRGLEDLLDRSLREDINTRLIIEPDLWPVEVDPSQLEVAVLNIALNARDAMPDGGTVTIHARNRPGDNGDPDGDKVELSIADTGSGMSPELISRVFEPFFTTKALGQGTGLGLSQVYGFARSSGGEVRIESGVGEGTTLILVFPRSFKTVAADTRADGPRRDRSERRYRVLLVEDDDEVADFVAQSLEVLGYDNLRVADAPAALRALDTEGAFDLVFSDMLMPGDMSGLDLARAVTSRVPKIPVVLTTGYSAAATAAAAESISLLLKPYRIEALDEELRKAIHGGSGMKTPSLAASARAR
jgi:signal transduction histidine kinase/ActR/RegA family two-component response regulator